MQNVKVVLPYKPYRYKQVQTDVHFFLSEEEARALCEVADAMREQGYCLAIGTPVRHMEHAIRWICQEIIRQTIPHDVVKEDAANMLVKDLTGKTFEINVLVKMLK